MEKYQHRQHAGQVLASYLQPYTNQPNVLVLAIPRGGVPVAFEIASSLSLPLSVFIVRKLGVPHHKELAMGALASGEALFLDNALIQKLKISSNAVQDVIKNETEELHRRESLYHPTKPCPDIKDKIILLVDDGIATGSTMRVGLLALRKQQPARIIVAVPVAALETYQTLSKLADEMICPLTPMHFNAVGMWYEQFEQTTDKEVIELLNTETCA